MTVSKPAALLTHEDDILNITPTVSLLPLGGRSVSCEPFPNKVSVHQRFLFTVKNPVICFFFLSLQPLPPSVTLQ